MVFPMRQPRRNSARQRSLAICSMAVSSSNCPTSSPSQLCSNRCKFPLSKAVAPAGSKVRNNNDSDVILRLCREVKLNLLRLGSSHLGLRHTKAILDIHAAVDRRIKGRLMAIHQQRRNARRAIEATLAIVWLFSALAAQAMDTSDDSAIVIDMSNKLSDQEAPPPAAEPEVVRAYQFQI